MHLEDPGGYFDTGFQPQSFKMLWRLNKVNGGFVSTISAGRFSCS